MSDEPLARAVGEHVEIVVISARLMGEKPKHVTCAF
jgi:hypothetical protein